MKYETRKMLLDNGEDDTTVEDRIVADIRFHIAVYKGTVEREKLIDALIEEHLWGDFMKSGFANLSDGTFIRLVGFQYGREDE